MFDVEMTMKMLKSLAKGLEGVKGSINCLTVAVTVALVLGVSNFILHLVLRR